LHILKGVDAKRNNKYPNNTHAYMPRSVNAQREAKFSHQLPLPRI
jgi:hypothetical protein